MGSRIVAAWRRYWFTPASLTDLGVSRIALVSIILYLIGATRYERVATVEPVLWTPVPMLELLGIGQPSLATIHWMTGAANLLLVVAGLGLLTRPALLVAFPLLVILEAMGNSMGKVTHAVIPLLYAVLFFGLGPSDRGFSLEAMWRRSRAAGRGRVVPPPSRTSDMAGWPLDLLYLELAAFYFFAGVSKLRDAGLAWIDGYTLQYHLLFKGTDAGAWLGGQLALCALLSALVLVFELGAPLGMIRRRLRPAFLASGLCFHLGTTLFLGISFWPVAALYGLFLPWRRLGGEVARATGLARRRLDVLYDGRCARCRSLVSLIRDLDLAGTVRFVDIPSEGGSDGFSLATCGRLRIVDAGDRVVTGSDAFRRLVGILPAGWPMLPVLFLPGGDWLGRHLYAAVSTHRSTALGSKTHAAPAACP